MLTSIAQAIYDLLLKEKGNALNGMSTSFPILRIESSALPAFDIIDKQPSIIQDTGSGTATYHNPRISPDTDKGIADSFGTIHSLMSGVVKLNFQPITKAGFALYQTDHIQF